MDFQSKFRDSAVYWPPGVYDEYGTATPGTLQEVIPGTATGGVRFSQNFESRIAVTGETDDPQATVRYDVDLITLERNGWIYKGVVGDLTAAQQADPRLIQNVGYIVGVDKIESLDGSQTLGVGTCNGR
jgi:hypothetical protein